MEKKVAIKSNLESFIFEAEQETIDTITNRSQNQKQVKQAKQTKQNKKLADIVDDYKEHPWYLTESEANLLLSSYLENKTLAKYGADNIIFFLKCHQEEWRVVWNTIHKDRASFQVRVAIQKSVQI